MIVRVWDKFGTNTIWDKSGRIMGQVFALILML